MYRYLHFDPCLLQTTYVLYVITAVYDNMISKIYLTIITLLKKLHSHENELNKKKLLISYLLEMYMMYTL
jgi:hypothetical protein